MWSQFRGFVTLGIANYRFHYILYEHYNRNTEIEPLCCALEKVARFNISAIVMCSQLMKLPKGRILLYFSEAAFSF